MDGKFNCHRQKKPDIIVKDWNILLCKRPQTTTSNNLLQYFPPTCKGHDILPARDTHLRSAMCVGFVLDCLHVTSGPPIGWVLSSQRRSYVLFLFHHYYKRCYPFQFQSGFKIKYDTSCFCHERFPCCINR